MSQEKKPIPRPQPRPDIYMETKPFWDAAKEHKLLIQYDPEVGRYQWMPRPVSIFTGKRNLEWREVSGKGKLYTWTKSHVAWPGHADRAPYICVLVELEEGVRMLANLYNTENVTLEDGTPLKLMWETIGEFEYPAFEPA